MGKYSASGGGDGPECVADALFEVLSLQYRPNAAKVCVFIADAPPHGLGESGDGFPNGSPHGHDPYEIGRSLAGKGVTVYVVGCEPILSSQYRFARTFFESIAELTTGQYCTLGSAAMLADVIIGGAREEMALEKLLAAAKEELELGAQRGEISLDDDDACEEYMSRKMQSKGYRASSLQCAGAELAPVSAEAKSWSKLTSLKEVREKTSAMAPPSRGHSGLYWSGDEEGREEAMYFEDSCAHYLEDSCTHSEKATKPSLFRRISGYFGAKPAAAPAAPAGTARRSSMSAPCTAPSHDFLHTESKHGTYSLEVQDLSGEQCHRLYSKVKSRR